MNRQVFINLPIKDVQRARAFYTALGFSVNEQFSGETSVCVVVSDTIHVMLLVESYFSTFTPRAICDATKSVEVLNCLSCASRDEVDDMVTRAVAAGGSTYSEANDLGFMYQHSFADPDGHAWELMHMPAAP